MMFMCTSKFDIESEQLALVDEYLTAWEIQAARGEKDAHKTGDEFNPISDDEEDAQVTISPLLRPPSECVPSKRPRIDITEDQEALNELNNENDEDENPLPDNSNLYGENNTWRRTSGWVPKCLR